MLVYRGQMPKKRIIQFFLWIYVYNIKSLYNDVILKDYKKGFIT